MNKLPIRIAITIIFGLAHCLRLVPERANVTYVNTKYIEYGRIYITRHGRRSPYYVNVEGKIKHLWNNNVTFNFVFYEYLHNEYRRSFVEMHIKYCDMMTSDPYVGGMLKNMGVECPAQPKDYHLLNMTVPMEDFPSVWPFQKCRVEGEFTITETKESMLKGYVYASFVEHVKKKNKS